MMQRLNIQLFKIGILEIKKEKGVFIILLQKEGYVMKGQKYLGLKLKLVLLLPGNIHLVF
jgi:hypothetical protein